MNSLIFGRTWEEIKTLQARKFWNTPIDVQKKRPVARQDDIQLLKDKGIDWTQENRFYGVIDRPQTSGIIPL